MDSGAVGRTAELAALICLPACAALVPRYSASAQDDSISAERERERERERKRKRKRERQAGLGFESGQALWPDIGIAIAEGVRMGASRSPLRTRTLTRPSAMPLAGADAPGRAGWRGRVGNCSICNLDIACCVDAPTVAATVVARGVCVASLAGFPAGTLVGVLVSIPNGILADRF